MVIRLVVLSVVLAGCGSNASCPNDLPASCPDPAPSFAATVQPIINARCTTCHAAGGEESSRPYTSYDAISRDRSAILDQVYGCQMPPSDATQLTSDERATLLNWLVCKAPDN